MRRIALLWIACAGCGSHGGTHDGGADLGRDLAVADDLATPPDLTALPPGAHQYAANKLLGPLSSADYALDLNGDGQADNQLGSILGALAGQGFDAQAQIDAAIANGEVVYLVRFDTADPNLGDDPMATAVLARGKPGVANFGGMGKFTLDANQPPSTFAGALAAATFSSEDPVSTKTPVDATLLVPLFDPSKPLALPLHGAHIRFTTGTDASSQAPGLLAGQINGSIKNSELQGQVIPDLAKQMDDFVQANPNDPRSSQLLALFDTGGCVGAQANDGRIAACEVATNPIAQALLVPDVQIYDAMGKYSPNPLNSQKDSLSVGIGFTAVRALF
jgi:hypothetical protein